ERPASGLFTDYARLCRIVTLAEYRARLGADFDPDRLIDFSEIGRSRQRADAEAAAFERMFGATLSPRRPLNIALDEDARYADAGRLPALGRLVRDAEHGRAALEVANQRCGELEERLDVLRALTVLEDLGVPRARWGEPDWVAGHLAGSDGPATAAAEARR